MFLSPFSRANFRNLFQVATGERKAGLGCCPLRRSPFLGKPHASSVLFSPQEMKDHHNENA